MSNIKYTCPCCDYKTLEEKPPGSYDICELCGWEDDAVQFDDSDYEGGANSESLREAQHDFQAQSKNEDYSTEYEKGREWKILSPPDGSSRTRDVKTNFVGGSDGTIYKK